MSTLESLRPKGNANVPTGGPIFPPQAFADVMLLFFQETFGSDDSILNVQKLSLPANTAVGTQVAVTDGFVVSGFGDARDGFYFPVTNTSDYPEFPMFVQLGFVDDGTHPQFNPFQSDASQWQFSWDGGNFTGTSVSGTRPWDMDWSGLPALTLTHPAIQQLTAPSTAQGGVFVAGGSQDGVWTDRGSLNGKRFFNLLGQATDSGNSGHLEIYWELALEDYGLTPSGAGFGITDGDRGNLLYYSLSDVATPDLATDWKNASDDSPASITVTSVTVGALNAGLKIGSDTYVVNGSSNGRNKYSDVLGVAPDYTFDGTKWTDGVTDGSGNTAFPWDGGVGTRDDVASENNWEIA